MLHVRTPHLQAFTHTFSHTQTHSYSHPHSSHPHTPLHLHTPPTFLYVHTHMLAHIHTRSHTHPPHSHTHSHPFTPIHIEARVSEELNSGGSPFVAEAILPAPSSLISLGWLPLTSFGESNTQPGLQAPLPHSPPDLFKDTSCSSQAWPGLDSLASLVPPGTRWSYL